ncbi:hypothetical protein HanPSC8_Chr03g0118501 [Helianthus annuus]|nr:hypothetical protein HanIR_Chr03g0132991 [Helianthus annuus]KAJ0944589.1 hypothetical protein HanPSC8_Chr03g0118501 [Helianthus annuus]
MLKRPRRRCEGTTMGVYHCPGIGISLFFSRQFLRFLLQVLIEDIGWGCKYQSLNDMFL